MFLYGVGKFSDFLSKIKYLKKEEAEIRDVLDILENLGSHRTNMMNL